MQSHPPLLGLSNLPVGGTTGICHQSTDIDAAIAWYRLNSSSCERPLIPALRRRFGLTPLEAIAVLREARR